MSDTTARFALPLLAPGQAQKEMFHNEALALIDVLQHASVVAAGLDVPPTAPAEGACWLVGAQPDGVWAGQAGAIAAWTAGGWRFIAPREGLAVWDAATRRSLRQSGGAWQVEVAPPAAAIASATGGSTVDSEVRASVAAILTALRQHRLIET
ncbi:DUF2793 domain-containing protein [Sphingomonas sp. RS2018]